jgi:hypothetical protein
MECCTEVRSSQLLMQGEVGVTENVISPLNRTRETLHLQKILCAHCGCKWAVLEKVAGGRSGYTVIM